MAANIARLARVTDDNAAFAKSCIQIAESRWFGENRRFLVGRFNPRELSGKHETGNLLERAMENRPNVSVELNVNLGTFLKIQDMEATHRRMAFPVCP